MAAASIPGDIPKLKTLLDKGFRVVGWEVTFNQDPDDPKHLVPRTVVSLSNGKDELELLSADLKFSMFVSSMHHTRGRDAATELRPFADLNKYWAEMEHLCVEHEKKRAEAFKRIDSRQFKFSYDPQKLLKEFLATREFSSAKFAPLKRDHFEVQAYCLRYAQYCLKTKADMHNNKPATVKYSEIIDRILMKAFRTDADFILNYVRFHDMAKLDVEDAVLQATGQHRHIEDLFRMLAARGPLQPEVGMAHLLDIYRRLSESLAPFIRVLSDAINIAESGKALDPNLGYERRVEFIKKSPYAMLMDCLDPRIRHSESHNASQIDKKAEVVRLTDTENGRRVTLHEYKFEVLSDMTRELLEGLFPVLLLQFHFHEFVLLLVSVMSPEYVRLLLNIENMAGPEFEGVA